MNSGFTAAAAHGITVATPVKHIEPATGYGAPVGATHESVGFDPSSDPAVESAVHEE